MAHVLNRYPELIQTTTEQKLELIDELWECVRRDDEVSVPASHIVELNRRLGAVRSNPSLALEPAAARALLKRR
jgi:Putative addiction module component